MGTIYPEVLISAGDLGDGIAMFLNLISHFETGEVPSASSLASISKLSNKCYCIQNPNQTKMSTTGGY